MITLDSSIRLTMYQSLFVDFVIKSCLHSLCMCGVCSYFLKIASLFSAILAFMAACIHTYTIFRTRQGRTIHNRAMLNPKRCSTTQLPCKQVHTRAMFKTRRPWLATTTVEQLYVVHKNASTLMPPHYLIRRHFAVASVSIP